MLLFAVEDMVACCCLPARLVFGGSHQLVALHDLERFSHAVSSLHMLESLHDLGVLSLALLFTPFKLVSNKLKATLFETALVWFGTSDYQDRHFYNYLNKALKFNQKYVGILESEAENE